MEIRAFDGALGDAGGVIAVDGETFGDCRYTPHYVAELVETGGQNVWVAEMEGGIVGFVSTFITHSLTGDRWEIDELAVRPSAQGLGIGTALVGCALDETPPELPARAVIAMGNVASQRAFAKNGFFPRIERHLLVRDALRAIETDDRTCPVVPGSRGQCVPDRRLKPGLRGAALRTYAAIHGILA
jgi:GNAT superfamily N-acetyltransferase